jgi:hypothetical protein
MFHPSNYILAFSALLLRFDIFSAIYARLSTAVLRTTINAPAGGVLFGLFPSAERAVIRPFLRGTVVRVGLLVGSGMVILSQGFMHPKYLSLVSVVVVAGWLGSSIFLKRVYSGILIDLISRESLDWRSLEEREAAQIFKDKKVEPRLVQAFLSARGEESVFYGRLMKWGGVKDLDSHILVTLKEQDDRTKMKLLPLLSSEAGKEALQVFLDLVDPDKPELMVAFARTARRVYADMPLGLQEEIFEESRIPEVKAYMVIGLYHKDPAKYHEIIDSWLSSDHLPERRAGVLAAGHSDNHDYISKLKAMLRMEEEASIISPILRGLHHLNTPEMNVLVDPYLSHPMEKVRLAALDVLEITNDDAAQKAIDLIGDPSDQVRDRAMEKLEASPYPFEPLLQASLVTPSRRLRDGIFRLAESLDIKDVDAIRFYRSELEKGYINLAEAEAVRHLPGSLERDLLLEHLEEKRTVQLDNVLRGLAAMDTSGQMRTIWRGISSTDTRQRANSLEALESMVDRSLSNTMIPLLENPDPSECLTAGRKHFNLPRFDSDPATICSHLLAQDDWVTVALALRVSAQLAPQTIGEKGIEELAGSENAHIQEANAIRLPERILQLRQIQMFEGLSVNELAAIALKVEERDYGPDEVVIKEGEIGEEMFMIVVGGVSVIKGGAGEWEEDVELERVGAGSYFGEMALFDDIVRSASIITTETTSLLLLHKQAFEQIMEEYPEIALNICRELIRRIRRLQEKVEVSQREKE